MASESIATATCATEIIFKDKVVFGLTVNKSFLLHLTNEGFN
jgi:hypothetical protein